METVSWMAIGLIFMSLAVAVTRKIPAAGALMMANFFVFVLSTFGPGASEGLSTIQRELSLHSDKLAAAEPIAFVQLFTSMFVHADFYHLFGNLIVLFAFAFPFEERIGPGRFTALYFIAGMLGSLAQVVSSWGDPIVLMGASGAVFGIIGAFAGSYPRVVLPLPLPLLIIMIFVRMRVVVAAIIFALMQILYLQFLSPLDNTAYWAHLGGLAAGLALAPIFKPRTHAEDRYFAVQAPNLAAFATNDKARSALSHMEANKDEKDVYQAWLQVFVEHAEDPDGNRLTIQRGQIQIVSGN